MLYIYKLTLGKKTLDSRSIYIFFPEKEIVYIAPDTAFSFNQKSSLFFLFLFFQKKNICYDTH